MDNHTVEITESFTKRVWPHGVFGENGQIGEILRFSKKYLFLWTFVQALVSRAVTVIYIASKTSWNILNGVLIIV
jgi:hypothetical protein